MLPTKVLSSAEYTGDVFSNKFANPFGLHRETSDTKTNVDQCLQGEINHVIKLLSGVSKALLFVHQKLMLYNAPPKMAAVRLHTQDIICAAVAFFFLLFLSLLDKL